jgi:hypothetical protein
MKDEFIMGNVTLFDGEVKVRVNGKTSTLATLRTEKERRDALENHLGVRLGPAEKDGIKNTTTEF